MLLRPRRSTLFPYTTLFRSVQFRQRLPGYRISRVTSSEQGRGRHIGVDRRANSNLVAIVRDREHQILGGIPLERNVDRKSTRLNSSHSQISYAVFCLKKKKN